MRIPLNEFEQYIDETILKRGLAYFEKDHVTAFTEISKGLYEALVEGTEEYTVFLHIKNNIIVENRCNCPYDLGPVCKHVAAVIFYLQQDNILEVDSNAVSKPRKKKTKPVTVQVRELLKTIPHNELMRFVEEHCKNDRKFRNVFLASFGHLGENQSKDFYQKQIRSILKAATGRDGWIGWRDMKYVVNTAEPLLKNAKRYLENNNLDNVFFISTALLEEMTEAFQYADDSNGDIGYFAESAMDLLYELTQEKLPERLRGQVFEYCISAFEEGVFSGWGWHLGMLDLACELTDKENEVDSILHCVDTIQGKYEIERAQTFKLKVLKRFKDAKEVEKYIDEHISNPSIRRDEIKKAFDSKNYESVIKLSKDGILSDEKNKPGLAKSWYNWLLKTAQAQKDVNKIIAYARFLFVDNFSAEQDYYQILKDNIPNDNWHSFLEDLIKEITPKTNWKYTEQIRKIYIKEQWWDRLFLMVKENPSLNNIEQNEKYLANNYAPELVKLYSDHITNYVEEYVGRNYYQTACRYLRRMKKLGGHDRVNELIELFREQYPKRRALQEELNRV